LTRPMDEPRKEWADSTIDCKHATRDVHGNRVCRDQRGTPHPDPCGDCEYRDPRIEGRGLGDWAELVVDVATAGQGKRVAKAVAKARGKKDCGCAKRKAKLNRMGKGVGFGDSEV